jgi:hypothetical protein
VEKTFRIHTQKRSIPLAIYHPSEREREAATMFEVWSTLCHYWEEEELANSTMGIFDELSIDFFKW